MNLIGPSTLERATDTLCSFSFLEKDGKTTLIEARRKSDGELEGWYVFHTRHGWEWKSPGVYAEPLSDERVPAVVRALLS